MTFKELIEKYTETKNELSRLKKLLEEYDGNLTSTEASQEWLGIAPGVDLDCVISFEVEEVEGRLCVVIESLLEGIYESYLPIDIVEEMRQKRIERGA